MSTVSNQSQLNKAIQEYNRTGLMVLGTKSKNDIHYVSELIGECIKRGSVNIILLKSK